MGLDAVASIKQNFNANLAPGMTMPLDHSSNPGMATASFGRQSIDSIPQLSKDVQKIEAVLGSKDTSAPSQGGLIDRNLVGAVGFTAAVVGGPIAAGIVAGAAIIEAGNFVKTAMSASKDEPTQFASFADLERGQDMMDFENEMMLSGQMPYVDAVGGTSRAGYVVNPNQPHYAPAMQQASASSISTKDRKELEQGLGAKRGQLDGQYEQLETVQKYASTNNIKMPGGSGNPGSGWTPPPPGFGA